jgi:hypothetical protein
MVFHIPLVMIIAKATRNCCYLPPLPFPSPRLAPFTGELHWVLACVEHHNIFITPRNAALHYAKARESHHVACSNLTVSVAFVGFVLHTIGLDSNNKASTRAARRRA